ncbi:MAG: hypothetical protein PHU12_03525, partial [Candidatus Aenigmarchaeota archaeon]|nr:hypothetical protein [Candidatus Aenigmarchaeota archaeon]
MLKTYGSRIDATQQILDYCIKIGSLPECILVEGNKSKKNITTTIRNPVISSLISQTKEQKFNNVRFIQDRTYVRTTDYNNFNLSIAFNSNFYVYYRADQYWGPASSLSTKINDPKHLDKTEKELKAMMPVFDGNRFLTNYHISHRNERNATSLEIINDSWLMADNLPRYYIDYIHRLDPGETIKLKDYSVSVHKGKELSKEQKKTLLFEDDDVILLPDNKDFAMSSLKIRVADNKKVIVLLGFPVELVDYQSMLKDMATKKDFHSTLNISNLSTDNKLTSKEISYNHLL